MSEFPKIIYLDLNVFSDFRDRLNKDNQLISDLFATLVWLKKNRNLEVPFSDIHIQELSMTGRKKDLQNTNFIKDRINKDLKIIDQVSGSKKIELNSLDGLFYVVDKSPLDQYEVYTEVSFFMDSLHELLNVNQSKMVEFFKTKVGLGSIVLNNCKNVEEAQSLIDEKVKKLPQIFESLSVAEKSELDQLRQEYILETNELIEKMRSRLNVFIRGILLKQVIEDESGEPIRNAIEQFNIQIDEAITQSQVDLNKKYTSHDFKMIGELSLKGIVDRTLSEHGVSIQLKTVESMMRNLWGFGAKSLKKGGSSDHFDIHHAEFLPIAYAFITNENLNFRKRFSNYADRIFSPEEFLNIMRSKYKIDIRVNYTDSNSR